MLLNKEVVLWSINVILLLALLILITLPAWGHPPPPGYGGYGPHHYNPHHRYEPYRYDYDRRPPPPARPWHPYYDNYRYRYSYPGWGCMWSSDRRWGCQFNW